MSAAIAGNLTVCEGVPVYIGGAPDAELDLWFVPAFGESHLCFREACGQPLAREARIVLFDPPGFGAARARAEGMTVADLAGLLVQLADQVSSGRVIAWVAHSMASIAAVRAAAGLGSRLRLVVSIEGNLTPEDAYLTGLAARYPAADAFYAALCAEVLARAGLGVLPMRYYASLLFADPHTLWTLGRSVLECRHPGEEFLRLGQKAVYYWDAESVPAQTRAFLSSSGLRERRMDGCGHWPMLACPERFYGLLLEDLLLATDSSAR